MSKQTRESLLKLGELVIDNIVDHQYDRQLNIFNTNIMLNLKESQRRALKRVLKILLKTDKIGTKKGAK